MNYNRLSVVVLILGSIVTGTFAATVIQERKTKQVTRVKRPIFSQRDWDGVYFENLFEQGLVGERPAGATPGEIANSGTPAGTGESESDSGSGELAWSNYISRTTIEDEVKGIQNRLVVDITTPVKFKSDYAKVNQSFSMLSVLFAIIREYDSDVRWKKDGAGAQISFERAAANSRVGTIQAYESCKRRRDMLVDLVRGGSFAADEKAPERLDWSNVVDRSPVMDRLEESMKQIKKLTSSKGEFTGELESLIQESELVAALALVLTQENMTDADDDGYLEFAMEMHKAAMQAVASCKNQDYDGASQAANLISQSCDNCHSEWR